VGHARDDILSLLFTFDPNGLSVDDLLLLSLHPLDVHNCLLLLFEIVAALPVSFALFVFLGVQIGELRLDALDLTLNDVELGAGLVLFGVRLLKFLSDVFHLFVKHILLLLNTLDLSPVLVLLSFKFLDFRVYLAEAFGLRKGCLQHVEFFNKPALSLSIH
jgi:hypothetical protein